MKEQDVAWLAGWLEGEGYFGYNSSLFIRVKSIDLDTLEKAQALVGKGNIRVERRDNPKHSPTWEWGIFGKNARRVMLMVYPYMCRRRKDRIRDALDLTNGKECASIPT